MRGIMVIAASLLAMQVSSAPVPKLPAGQTEKVLELRPLIDMPEGIAIDRRGHIFVGNRRLENDARVSEIQEIAPDGAVRIFATFDPPVLDSFDAGVLGLAIGPDGELFAAVASHDPRTHGVWRLGRDGANERLAGSKRMLLPNALEFDPRGNLYVTDSADGAIWRFPRGGRGRLWIRHPLLAPDPLIGANGIAFVAPNNLYVANLDRALIGRIRIRPDGTPAEPEIDAAGFELLGIDGLAADARGMLYACIIVSAALGTAPVVQVDPATGKIAPATINVSAFDLPTSLAFGRGPLDHKSVYVVNSGLFPEGRPEAAPGVVRVGLRANGPR
jgi:sugar lactone lactonase YvrE